MIQDVLAKLKSMLSAQMPGKLDAIDVDRLTTTPDIVEFYTYPKDEEGVFHYPVCFIEAQDTACANQVGRWRSLTHTIGIFIEHRNAQEDVLEKELLNFVEAIEKIISADPALQGTVDNSEITGHGYSETAREDTELPWLKAAAVRLTVKERYQP